MRLIQKGIKRSLFSFKSTCKINRFSTKPLVKNNESPVDELMERYVNEMDRMSTIYPRNRTKLPQRPPFAKNLFLGQFDTEVLTYPQLQKADIDKLEEDTNILRKTHFELCEVPNLKEYLRMMKRMRCIGLLSSLDEEGRELNETEKCRYYEVLFNKNNYKLNLHNNELCILALSKFGTEEQKQEIMKKLIDGELSSMIILGENTSKITANFQNNNTFILNGKKMYVINVDETDLFLVFAHMDDSIDESKFEMDLTAFLVDKNSPGINIESSNITNSSLKGTSSVSFENTPVTSKNILGTERGGRGILSSILPNFHLDYSVMNLNILKETLNFLTNTEMEKSKPSLETHKTETVVSVLSQILSYNYMVESAIYLTSGLMSSYENQDCELESLMTRLISSKLALEATTLGFSLEGTPTIDHTHPIRIFHEEALSNYTLFENEKAMKILVSLMGLQHAGQNIGESVKKLRNPLFNPGFILKKLWNSRKLENDSPNLNIGLKNYLHPALQIAADEAEYCILRFQYATEMLFGRYGIDVLNKHCHLARLAEVAMEIYIMIACLGRSSRSYCIGLRHGDMEMNLAKTICRTSTDMVRKNINELLFDYQIVDDSFNELTKNLFSEKEYYFVHPLTRNF